MPPSPSSLQRRRLLGGWAGVVGPVAYVATWLVAGALREGYDPVAQAISDLAAIGAPTRGVMTAAFVVFGLLALPFADALRLTLPGDARPLAAMVAASGLATVAAGVVPCTEGCPGPAASATDLGHAVAATVGYVALMASPLLCARLLWSAGRSWRTFAVWSAITGVVGSVLLALWALGVFGDHGGLVQRIFNSLADVWWAAAALVVLAEARLQRAVSQPS